MDKLWEQYQNEKKTKYITDKQKNLLINIFIRNKNKLTSNFKHLDINNFYSIVLKKNIKSIKDITHDDCKYIIKTHENKHENDRKKLNNFNIFSKEYIIYSNHNFEIGFQQNYKVFNNQLFYIKFYDFLVLDYDLISIFKVRSILKSVLEKIPHLNFHIYKTRNGYHVFLMNQLLDHYDYKTAYLMTKLQCDMFYIKFSFKNGFKIRLSPKCPLENYKHNINQVYIEEMGSGQVIPKCSFYKNIMDKTCQLFRNID